ncbi:MAG TPA: acyltransferase [Nevskiaceae bacterium]|nr:acyltransferase [Nevskiaceae bacterium]
MPDTLHSAAPVTPASAAAARLQGLDGLRGLAMLMVIACHLNVLWIGWTGLASFFVLSGFLITRILLSDRAQAESLGGYFRRFYIRRTLRVFPIYYIYLLLLTVAALTVPALTAVRGELPTAFLYLYNFHMMFPHEHTRTLGHLWSLSVEEQFYLVWPWVVAFLSRSALRNLCMALIVIGPLLRWWTANVLLPAWGLEGPPQSLIYMYIFTGTHLDGFAFGALLNLVDVRARDWQVGALLLVSLALGLLLNQGMDISPSALGWPLFLPAAYQYTWGYSVVDLFWALTIAAIVGGSGAVKKLYTLPLLDYLGKRSYSTYIVHFPLLALMNPLWQKSMNLLGDLPGTAAFAVPYLAIVFAVSGLSFRYVETPISELKDRFSTSRRKAAAASDGAGARAEAS